MASASKSTKAQLAAEVKALRAQVSGLESALRQARRTPPNGDRVPVAAGAREQSARLWARGDQIFHKIFREGPLGMAVVDRDFRILEANTRLCEMLGYTQAELQRLTFSEVTHPEDLEGNLEEARALLRGEALHFQRQTRYRRKDGSWLPAKLTASVVENDRGEAAYGIAMVEDMTKQSTTEQELQSHRLLLETVFDTLPTWVFAKDSDHRYIFVNRTMAEFFGQDQAHFTGKRFEDIYFGSEEVARTSREADRHVLDFGETQIVEKATAPRPDGILHTFRLIKVPLRDAKGAVAGIVGIAEDVTEQQQSERQIRESRRMLQTVLDTVPHSIFLKNLDGEFLLVNRSMGAKYGMEPREMIGKIVAGLPYLTGEQKKAIQEGDRRIQETGQTVIIDNLQVNDKEGRLRYEHVIKMPFFDEGGRIVGQVSIAEDITEQKRTREELEQFKTTLDQTHDCIFMFDAETWKFFYVNNGAIEQVGYSREELAEMTPLDIKPEFDEKSFRDLTGKLTGGGSASHVFETVHRHKGGRHIPVEILLQYLPAEGEKPRFIAIVRDIGERKQAEKEQQESRRMLQTIIDTVPHVIFLKDLEDRYLMMNRSGSEQFGLEPEQLVGRTTGELPFLTEEEKKKIQDHDQQVIASGQLTVNEDFALSIIGGRHTLQRVIKRPYFDEDGRVAGHVGIAEDITEQRRAEEKLQESELKHRHLVEGSIQGIAIIQNLILRFANKALADIYGYESPEELIGRNTLELFIAPHEQERIGAMHLARLRGEDVPSRYEFQGLRSNGALIWLEGLATEVMWNGEKAAQVTYIDITERKELEDKLRQSQKMEALGTLAGGIAHDFNNILTPILGYAEILLDTIPPGSRELGYVSSISSSALRARDLVAQILLFSRRGKTRKLVTDLKPVMGEVIGLIRSTLSKSITIEEEIDPQLAAAYCDSSQIYQMLLNLCVNAEQAMKESGVLRVSFRNAKLHGLTDYSGRLLYGKYLRLAVSDTGVGMNAEVLKQIFDPFFTNRGIGEGTGLGLSTVFGIVNDHDGGIVVSSEPGQGATFEIYLPAIEDRSVAAQRSEIPVPAGNENVLFIDDEEEVTKLAREVLEDFGYRVTAFSDPSLALAQFKADPRRFDLVITDQSMPGMKGEWLARDIRRITPGIPIILCTGYSRTINPEISEVIGIDAFLYKPIRNSELGRVVRQVLDDAAGRRTASLHAGD